MNVIARELKKQFSIKHFGFTFPKAEAFYAPQWKWPTVVFVIYRVVLAGFTLGTLTAYFGTIPNTQRHLMVYMTSWSYILLTLHFTCSAFIVVYRLCRKFCLPEGDDPDDNATLKSISSCSYSPSHSTGQEMNSCNEPCHIGDAMNNCVLPGHQHVDSHSESSIDDIQYSSPSKLNLPSTESSGCTLPGDHHYMNIENGGSPVKSKKLSIKGCTFRPRQDQARWYMKVSWFLFNTSASAAVIVTILYFGFIYPYLIGSDSFVDIGVHGINTVLVAIEFVVSAYPVRLLHVIYTIIFGLLYIIFSLVYWAQAPDDNIIYLGILDWNRPKPAIILICILFFIAIPFLQSMFFLLYKCRLRCYHRIYKENYTT